MTNNRNNKGLDLSAFALEIYIYALKKNPQPITFSHIKEDLGLSKSTIHYNLERLKKEGLLEETPDGLVVKQFEQLPALKHYIWVFGRIMPRYVLFMAFFVSMCGLLLVTELIPQVKLLSFLLAVGGLIWTIHELYKFRL